MNDEVKLLLENDDFVRGRWIRNIHNYDGELQKIVGPALGWKRDNASSHDFLTSRGEKIEVKKFMNGNGFLAGKNMLKTPDDVTYMFVVYNKQRIVTKVYMIPFTVVKKYTEDVKKLSYYHLGEIVKMTPDFNGQLPIRQKDLNNMVR